VVPALAAVWSGLPIWGSSNPTTRIESKISAGNHSSHKCVTGVLWPRFEQTVSNWVFPVMFGELAIMLWLIITGAKERHPLATADWSCGNYLINLLFVLAMSSGLLCSASAQRPQPLGKLVDLGVCRNSWPRNTALLRTSASRTGDCAHATNGKRVLARPATTYMVTFRDFIPWRI